MGGSHESFIEVEMERVGIASDYGVFIFSSSWGDVGRCFTV